MPVLVQYLHVIGAFQGILLAGLLIFGTQVSTASRILGFWCLFLGMRFLGPFIYIEGELNAFSPLIGIHMFLPASYGSFLYLYCRHAIVERPLSPKDLLYFLPILLCYLVNIELYLSSPEIKLDAILNRPEKSQLIMVGAFIMYLQAFVFLGMSVILINRYQKQAKQTLSNFNPELFAWLWKLLLVDLLIWLLQSAAAITDYYFLFSTTGDMLIIALTCGIALAQWRNPVIFRIAQLKMGAIDKTTNDSIATLQVGEVLSIEANHNAIDTTSDDNSGTLDSSIRSSLLEVVRQHMHDHKSYLDNQLTLTRLAENVGLSTHHLSEVLNQHEGKNFYRFVNEYRINFICDRLKGDREIKILDLAMTAGFSSKSTFNAVFKQINGMTPTQYRSSLH